MKLLYDSYKRRITYLRVSVTDRCNLRCTYCMPENGIKLLSHQDILSFEEITRVIKYATEHGVYKIRITGGEPLVRKNIVNLVAMIAEIPGIQDLSMTTNGQWLAQYAYDLKKAGLHRINVSLDTLDPEKFKQITRGGILQNTLDGIFKALEVGFYPIKLNCVIENSTDEDDAKLVKQFAEKHGFEIRFIQKMNLEKGIFSHVIGGEGGKCHTCHRLRLSAKGDLVPCLFSDLEYNIREWGIEKAFELALKNKPCCGHKAIKHSFYSIGG
ncbi:MAG: radical SAM protein [Bacteroidales bacterium]|nr:radical SAM protein [Bacteroidales bacterium]